MNVHRHHGPPQHLQQQQQQQQAQQLHPQQHYRQQQQQGGHHVSQNLPPGAAPVYPGAGGANPGAMGMGGPQAIPSGYPAHSLPGNMVEAGLPPHAQRPQGHVGYTYQMAHQAHPDVMRPLQQQQPQQQQQQYPQAQFANYHQRMPHPGPGGGEANPNPYPQQQQMVYEQQQQQQQRASHPMSGGQGYPQYSEQQQQSGFPGSHHQGQQQYSYPQQQQQQQQPPPQQQQHHPHSQNYQVSQHSTGFTSPTGQQQQQQHSGYPAGYRYSAAQQVPQGAAVMSRQQQVPVTYPHPNQQQPHTSQQQQQHQGGYPHLQQTQQRQVYPMQAQPMQVHVGGHPQARYPGGQPALSPRQQYVMVQQQQQHQQQHAMVRGYPGPRPGARMMMARPVQPPQGALIVDPAIQLQQQQHMQAFRNPRPQMMNPMQQQQQQQQMQMRMHVPSQMGQRPERPGIMMMSHTSQANLMPRQHVAEMRPVMMMPRQQQPQQQQPPQQQPSVQQYSMVQRPPTIQPAQQPTHVQTQQQQPPQQQHQPQPQQQQEPHPQPQQVPVSTSDDFRASSAPQAVTTATSEAPVNAQSVSQTNQKQQQQQQQQAPIESQVPSETVHTEHLSQKETEPAEPDTIPSPPVEIQRVFTDKVSVPWGWRRLILSDSVIYYSPSGANLKTVEDAKAYLLQEGTCKCGLECPLDMEKTFDFDENKQSEVVPFSMDDSSISSQYCAHKKLIGALASQDGTPNFLDSISHKHNPILQPKKGGTRKRKQKQKPFSGLKVAQMLEARESERQRINEIIMQQKREYEESQRGSAQPEAGPSRSVDEEEEETSSQTLITSTVEESPAIPVTEEEEEYVESQEVPETLEHAEEEVDEGERAESNLVINDQQEIDHNDERGEVRSVSESESESEAENGEQQEVPEAVGDDTNEVGDEEDARGDSETVQDNRSTTTSPLQGHDHRTEEQPEEQPEQHSVNYGSEKHTPELSQEEQEVADEMEEETNAEEAEDHQASTEVRRSPEENEDKEEEDEDEEEEEEEDDVQEIVEEAEAESDIENPAGSKVVVEEEEESIDREMDSDRSNDGEEEEEEEEEENEVVEVGISNKNLEIRRMSTTEDGNKILNDAWDSPEKEEKEGEGKAAKGPKRTPLEMVENIVSSMELASSSSPATTASVSETDSPLALSPVPGTSSSVANQSLSKAAKKTSNKHVLLPPLAHCPPTWTQTGRPLMHSQQQQQQQQSTRMPLQIGTGSMVMQQLPTGVVVSSSSTASGSNPGISSLPGQPPMMHLVNTINGPVLMHAVSFNNAGGTSGVMQQHPHGALLQQAGSGQGSSNVLPGTSQALPTGINFPQGKPVLKKRQRKGKKESALQSPASSQASHLPILMSPNMHPHQQQQQQQQQITAQTAANGQQFLTISSQPSPNSGHMLTAGSPSPQALIPQQNIIFNQATGTHQMVATNMGNQMLMSNGAFVTAMPTVQATGLVLNQLPDGSFVQVPASNQQGLITQMPTVIQGGQQLLTAAGGPFLVNTHAGGNAAAGGQFIQGNGAFIMASAHHSPGLMQQQQQQQQAHHQQQQQMMISPARSSQSPHQAKVTPPKASTSLGGASRMDEKSTDSNDDDSDDDSDEESESEDEEENEGQEEDDDEDEDEDEDDEEEEENEREEQEREREAERLAQEMLAKSSKDKKKRKRPQKAATQKPRIEERSQRRAPPPRNSRSTSRRNAAAATSTSKKSSPKASSSAQTTPKSSPEASTSKTSPPRIFIQSNQVDSSGLKATPPHHSSSNSGADFDAHHPNQPSSSSKSDEDEDAETSLDTSGGSSNLGASTSTSGGGATSSTRRRRKRNADQLLKENLNNSDDEDDEAQRTSQEETRDFSVGEVVWGAHGNFPSWPGKLLATYPGSENVKVCWFGTKEVSEVSSLELKNLSDGLEAHHRERKKLRKGRKMNASLEKAIQEAMTELD